MVYVLISLLALIAIMQIGNNDKLKKQNADLLKRLLDNDNDNNVTFKVDETTLIGTLNKIHKRSNEFIF